MSRIEELKKQNPAFNIDGIAIMNNSLGKSKYTEMAINLIKHKILENNENRHNDLIYELQYELGFDEEYLNSLTYMELSNIVHLISNYFGYYNFRLIKEFIDLNEKKLIENNDLTAYKTFNELELQISLSNLKNIDKEMTKQVQKLYETDEWLLVKPLSYQASLKYGASTKWCTASKDNAEYYFRYSKRGILIYSINKKTGNKVAGFKSVDENSDPETSFWSITDQRIDSMDSGLPTDVLDIFRNEFSNTKQSNWDILTDEERNRQILWLENEYHRNKKSSRVDELVYPPIPMEETMNYAMEPQNEVPVTRRIRRLIPLRNTTIDAEQELTRLLEEQMTEEIISEAIRLADDYPDQAG
jgi:hypothetical protein